MAGPPNNIPLRAKGYLESGIGLITTLVLTRTLTLTLALTLTLTHTLRPTRTPPRTRTLSRTLPLTLTLTLTLSYPSLLLPPIDFLTTSVLRNSLKRESYCDFLIIGDRKSTRLNSSH